MRKEILLVEDDLLLGHTLARILTKSRYTVQLTSSVENSFALLRKNSFEVIILDQSLPDGSGNQILEFVDNYAPSIKVMMLTKNSDPKQRTTFFNHGGIDYLQKPCDIDELLVRLKRLLKWKVIAPSKQKIKVGALELDLEKSHLIIAGKNHSIRKKEFQILEHLCLNKNRVVSHKELQQHVWGAQDFPVANTIQVYISNLRTILRSTATIKTIRGFGYSLIG